MRFKPHSNVKTNNDQNNKAMAPTTFIVYVITTFGLMMMTLVAATSEPHKHLQHKNHHQQNHHDQHNKHPQQQQRKSSHRESAASSSPPAATTESCDAVKEAFVHRGIGAAHLVPETPTPGSGLKHCPSARTCCRESMVRKYQTSIVKDYDSVVATAMAPVKQLLERSIVDFERHFNELLEISLNKTNHLFQAVYPRMASEVAPRLHDLYADFGAFLLQGHKVDVLDSLRGFFDGLFPSVYRALNPKLTDFTDDYKECLQQARSEVHPFGEVMRGIETTIPHALTAAELFLNAVRTGSHVINATKTITSTHECNHALLKLTYCAHCSGHTTVTPCWGMCLNVMRGCLAQLSEIDRNWNQYINALEDLIGVMKSPFNLEEIINEFPEKISEAIMHAQEHGKELDGRVRRQCGQPKRVKPQQHVSTESHDHDSGGHRQKRNAKVTPFSSTPVERSISARLNSFIQAMSPSKGFFINLADTTCKDAKFSGHAHQGQHCWNGIEIGAYNRTIVGIGLEKQENNPELKVQKHDGANSKVIATILEKLLRIKQHMTGSPVTREITKSAKRTRSGGREAFSARGAREAQYWSGNTHDSGSGYYHDDKYYDDEDLYQGSADGEVGSGYPEPGSGGGGVGVGVTHMRKPGGVRSKTALPPQPIATKKPTTHTYIVNPVLGQPNGASGLDTVLSWIVTACGTLLLGVFV